MSRIENYFEPEVQNAFWEAMTPDVRQFLDQLEDKETWTYTLNEFESLFKTLAKALPDIVELPLEEEHQSIIHKLIPVLLSMPLRQCISAVAYLDKFGGTAKNPIGWGVVCYLEAAETYKNQETEKEKAICFKTFCERIQVFIHSTVSVELFLHLNKEVVKNG